MFEYIPNENLLLLGVSTLMLFISIILFQSQRKIALCILALSTTFIGLFIATLDPFLWIWDERFHALVAKNLAENPLKPTLYKNPVLPYDSESWITNHVWMHKQPMSLWQIAASIKLFGINALSVRIPSILVHTVTTLVVYRIGSILRNPVVGYLAAVLFAFSFFQLELISGRYATDHNDVSFLCYVSCSIWGLLEYITSKNRKWLFVIGISAGLAVLTKWLMGFLVYIVWAIFNTTQFRKNRSLISIISPALLLSFALSLLTCLPWQLFAYVNFPTEYLFETFQKGHHFTKIIEGHHEPMTYYFYEVMAHQFGKGALIPVLVWGSLVFLFFKTKSKENKIILITMIGFVYLFFTIAATKMVAFTNICAPFLYIGLANTFIFLYDRISNKKSRIFQTTFLAAITLFTAYSFFNLSRITKNHTDWKPNDNFKRTEKLEELKLAKRLERQLESPHIIFNVDQQPYSYITVMFYTKHTAYHYTPEEVQLKELLEKGYKLAYIHQEGELPSPIANNPQITVLFP